MAKVNRSDVIQKAVNDLSISTSSDKVPSETLDKIQLTYDLNKNVSNFVSHASISVSGTSTLTLPVIDPRSEIYLTSLDFDFSKDATNDASTGAIAVNCTPDMQGIARTICAIANITLTAQQKHITLNFAYPLKLKPNSTLSHAITYTTGVCMRTLSIAGFITSSN